MGHVTITHNQTIWLNTGFESHHISLSSWAAGDWWPTMSMWLSPTANFRHQAWVSVCPIRSETCQKLSWSLTPLGGTGESPVPGIPGALPTPFPAWVDFHLCCFATMAALSGADHSAFYNPCPWTTHLRVVLVNSELVTDVRNTGDRPWEPWHPATDDRNKGFCELFPSPPVCMQLFHNLNLAQ